MSRSLQARPLSGSRRIGIVISRYNGYIVDRLLEGAMLTLQRGGIAEADVRIVEVPGAFEIPIAAAALADAGGLDAIITLGAVIRGETPHFDYICEACALGVSRIGIDYRLPVILGVLTVDSAEQALDRAGDEESNKGSEAARTALQMISVLERLENED